MAAENGISGAYIYAKCPNCGKIRREHTLTMDETKFTCSCEMVWYDVGCETAEEAERYG
jgi:hypothetical protein